MKRIATLVTGLVIIFGLAACNAYKGREVKEEAFKEKADKIEEHQYTEALVKFSYTAEAIMPNASASSIQEEQIDDEGIGSLFDGAGNIETTFTLSNGRWESTNKEANGLLGGIVGTSVKKAELLLSGFFGRYFALAEKYDIDRAIKYYVNPFGIERSVKGDFEDKETNTSGSVDVYTYFAFEKYGYLNKLEIKDNIETYTIFKDKVYENKVSGNYIVSITYK